MTDQMRETFERVARDCEMDLSRHPDGQYLDALTADQFDWWRDAWKAARRAEPEKVEPALWQYRMRGEWASEDCWTPWDNCSEASAYNYIRAPISNGWIFETRALYAAPQQEQK